MIEGKDARNIEHNSIRLIFLLVCLLISLTSCSKKLELLDLNKVKQELNSYEYGEHRNLTFKCGIPTITANEVYVITMNSSISNKTTENDVAKLKKAVDSVYGIDLPIETISLFRIQGEDETAASMHPRFEVNGYGGEVYNEQSTFMLWKDVSSLESLNLNYCDYSGTQRYGVADYPKDEFGMLDGSTLTIDKAIEQANGYIAKLKKCNLFDDGESQILSNIIVANTDNGKVIVLHYRQVRYDLDVDDGGTLLIHPEVDQVRNPFFEVAFAGDNNPFNIRNMYSDGVKEKQATNIIPLSEAEMIISDSLAPNISNDVYDVSLRYCCVYQLQDESRIFHPMWCFTLSDVCMGEKSTWTQYFPRITGYVDAINGNVYYSDSQRFILEKLET